MLERHLTFNVHPDRTADFERFFESTYRPQMAESPGYLRGELLRELDAPTRYQMVLRFSDADSALGWRTSDAHATLLPDLSALHSGMEVAAYEVVD